MRALRVQIFKNNLYKGCSNHGISERFDEILLICPEGIFEVKGDEPNLCKMVTRNTWGGHTHNHIEPVAKPNGVGWMSGGSLVYSSDSRFGFEYPLQLHDRCESQELYDSFN